VSGAGWRGLVVGLLAITVTVSAFYWVLAYGPRQVTATVTVLASPLDGGGFGRVLDVCFSWARRCDMMVVCLIDSTRSRVLVAAYSFKIRWIAEALIRAHRPFTFRILSSTATSLLALFDGLNDDENL
jgi:hypothetical protein